MAGVLAGGWCGAINAADSTARLIVDSDPVKGAIQVSQNLDSIEVEFSEPMAPAVSFTSHGDWGSSSWLWLDQTRLRITRNSAGTPLPDGTSIVIVFNPETQPGLSDLAGNFLETWTLSFSVGDDSTPPSVVNVNPYWGAGSGRDRRFHHPGRRFRRRRYPG